MRTTNHESGRRGLSAPEVIVVVALACVVVLCLLVAIPRQRETARLAACRRNLMDIGQALSLYDGVAGHLPVVRLGERGPLGMVLVELGVPNLRVISPKTPPRRTAGGEPSERPVPGFICGSDPNALAGIHPAPVSYRATTGDLPDGRNGAFAPGRQTGFAAIEAADGTGFTALFSERLTGDGRSGVRTPANYARVGGPLTAPSCPEAPEAAWHGDTGARWTTADWPSTLYTHALAPGAVPSCVADDGRSALMGASSGHSAGVNVLFADLSVRTFTTRVDLNIWREWARYSDPAPRSP